MSERMTDDELEMCASRSYWGHVTEETRRARASEEQKDAVIKALADALEEARAAHEHGRARYGISARIDAALRLAGRLP